MLIIPNYILMSFSNWTNSRKIYPYNIWKASLLPRNRSWTELVGNKSLASDTEVKGKSKGKENTSELSESSKGIKLTHKWGSKPNRRSFDHHLGWGPVFQPQRHWECCLERITHSKYSLCLTSELWLSKQEHVLKIQKLNHRQLKSKCSFLEICLSFIGKFTCKLWV